MFYIQFIAVVIVLDGVDGVGLVTGLGLSLSLVECLVECLVTGLGHDTVNFDSVVVDGVVHHDRVYCS